MPGDASEQFMQTKELRLAGHPNFEVWRCNTGT